jgi:outer membrane protein
VARASVLAQEAALKAQVFVWTVFPALIAAGGPCLAQAKLGYVTLERILREAPSAQRAQKKIEQEFSKRDQDLAKTGEQLKKMQESLDRNAMTMSESERQRREREFGDLSRDFQRRQREFREDLEQRRKEELSSVLERANRAVRKIAEEEKLDIVFQSEQVVWANPRIDITDKVIKALEDTQAGK